MARAIALRADFEAATLRRLARRSREGAPARRLLTLAAVDDGGTRSEAARLGNVTLRVVRDWVTRLNAGGRDGLREGKAPGLAPRLSEAHRRVLAAQIDCGPIPTIHGVVRWRPGDLGRWLWKVFRVTVSLQTLGREVRAMGYRKLSARPKHHAQAPGAIETFKKKFPATLAGIARAQGRGLDAIEIWFADEARVGQKNGITRRWARLAQGSVRRSRMERQGEGQRGTRPSAPQDQRYASTYIFGAVCLQDGKGAALILPFRNIAAMNLHLAEISAMVDPAKHTVLQLDQAGWHLSGDVGVPSNITLLPCRRNTRS